MAMRQIVFLVTGALLLVAALFAALSFTRYHAPREFTESPRITVIAPGTGARAMLRQLHAEGLTPAPWLMLLPMMVAVDPRSLKAGEYEISSGMAPADIFAKIARGEILVHQITIPEGFSVSQIRALLLAEPLLTGALPKTIPEGSIFPDTERFIRGEARSALVERLQLRMQEKLSAAWEARAPDLPITTKEEALILASLVEKETGIAEERPRVAAVFINRLRAGMRLQSDPTVAYGTNLARADGTLRQLTTRDLQADHPWNSYTRDGLPLTPIASPGLAAIEAVLNPMATDEYYFVATGDGGHRFARTLAEHNSNVAEYRRALRKQQE
jgi:UPF0755 protein